jgi:glycosyltransferase involved in cell wall biosynthesis
MKKTRLLFLTRRYSPHIGGVETHLENINQLLITKKFDICVVTEKHEPALLNRGVVHDVDVRRISLPNQRTSKIFIWWWVVRHFILFLRADIIHIHDVFFWILPIYPLLKISRKKIFITFHGYEAPGPLTKKQIFWHRLAARWTHGNICVGGFHKKYYGVLPNNITYGGVKVSASPLTRKKKDSIIFVGRLAKDTGILEYLQALLLLKEQGCAFHLDVFGDGELRRQVENFIQKHSLDVTVHGFVENATQYFGEYEIVFASQYLTVLEAMSQKCSIISYADTPIKNDYLILTPFSEWITIAHSSQELANSVIRPKAMSKHGIGWAKKQTWEKVMNEYLDLWKK